MKSNIIKTMLLALLMAVAGTAATYADETVLNEKGRIDCHTFKPVLFEFPTYAYFMTGEKAGDCGRMNA